MKLLNTEDVLSISLPDADHFCSILASGIEFEWARHVSAKIIGFATATFCVCNAQT